jgi:hypothetical protein
MPSQYPQNVVTKKGLAMIAESVATKKNLIFTRVVVGDGNATGRSFNDMDAVISPKMELPVTAGINEGNGQYLITATLSNNKLDVGFFPREVGLYAKVDGKQEMLYSYTNGGNNVGYVSDKTTPIDSEIYKIRTVIGNATNVTFKFVDSTFVTKGELDLHNSDINAHENQFRRYLPLVGGSVTGDINFENGQWAKFKNNGYIGGIRVLQNGIMDVGVNNSGAIENLNICSQNRFGWYSPNNGGTKPVAIVDDITNHNTDENAHQTITSAIAKILGDSNWKVNPAATLKDIKNLLGMGGIVAQRLEETGFVKFANGFIIQWGIFRRVAEAEQGGNGMENQQTRRFPISFATNKAILVCGDCGNNKNDRNAILAVAVPGAVSVRGRIVDKTSFKVAVDSSDGTMDVDISYIAVGI